MVAQTAADAVTLTPTSEGSNFMYGGFCMPFDLAIVILIIGASVLYLTWNENVGSDNGDGSGSSGNGPLSASSSERGDAEAGGSSGDGDRKKEGGEVTFANLVDVQGLQKGVTLYVSGPTNELRKMKLYFLNLLTYASIVIFVFLLLLRTRTVFSFKINISGTTGTYLDGCQSMRRMRRDPVIAICGMLQSLFEGSMYIFVFMWTPALTPPPTSAGLADSNSSEEGVEHATPPPYGQMFATFMVCCMCGSSLFSMLSKKWGLSAESLLLRVFLASSLALSVPVFFAGNPTLTYGKSSDIRSLTVK